MDREKSQAQPDQRRLRVGEHGAGGLAARMQMQDHDKRPDHDGKNGQCAGGKRADAMACSRHHGDDERRGTRAQRQVISRTLDVLSIYRLAPKGTEAGMVTARTSALSRSALPGVHSSNRSAAAAQNQTTEAAVMQIATP